MIKVRHVIGCAALMLGSQYIATPAWAGDTVETGLLAALGIEAASGDTTLGEKGGEIEGFLLASRTMNEAARAIIGQLGAYQGKPILLLTREEAVNLDLNLGAALSRRIGLLRAKAESATTLCSLDKQDKLFNEKLFKGLQPAPADFAGVLRTDKTITGFDIALGERALIDAIGAANAKGPKLDLRIPSDLIAAAGKSSLIEDWNMLKDSVHALRPCADRKVESAATVVKNFDALSAEATTPGEKGAPSPLERAAALGDLAGADIKLLRVSVDKVGGTAVTRSNIFVRLGFGEAVRISGGLVANFRVVDPATGGLEQSGRVNCAIAQTDFKSVRKHVLDGAQTADCILSN